MSEHAVVCLAAGKTQVIVIRKLKELGYAVVGVDRDSNAPGLALCDHAIHLSTHEPGAVIDGLRACRDRFAFAGVVCRSAGPPVVTAARAAQALGLPGVPPESAEAIVDKARLRERCAACGIPGPVCLSAGPGADVDLNGVDFPCVVKPALSLVGKSGVRRAGNPQDLAAAVASAREASENGVVNIEAYVRGRDITLMSVVRAGRVHPVALLDELNSVDERGCAFGAAFAIPSAYAGGEEERRTIALAERLAKEFALDTTPFMLCCRCEPGGKPKLIEIHLDWGGDQIFDRLIPASTDADVLGACLKLLLGSGGPPAEGLCPPADRLAPAAVVFERTRGRNARVLKAADRAELALMLQQDGLSGADRF